MHLDEVFWYGSDVVDFVSNLELAYFRTIILLTYWYVMSKFDKISTVR